MRKGRKQMQEILLITRAMDFAARKHPRQKRKGVEAEPYVNHLVEVAQLLAEATTGEEAKRSNRVRESQRVEGHLQGRFHRRTCWASRSTRRRSASRSL